MSRRERRKKKLSAFFKIPLLLGLFLAAITVLVYFIDWPVGVILTVFLVIYFIFTLYMYLNNSEILRREMLDFATSYEQMQGELLKRFDVPYALLDDSGKIEWINDAFAAAVHKDADYRRSITTIFPSVRRESFPGDGKDIRIQVELEGSSYMAQIKKLNMADLLPSNTMLDEKARKGELYSLFLIDNTAARLAIQEVDDQSMVVGFVYIDNYEEAVDTLEDVRKSLLVALIDRKVTKYFASIDGICSKMEKDKYLIVMRKKALRQLEEDHFDLLEDAKTVKIGNEMAITLSIGIGLDGLSYAQNYEFARNAIDLALGRGGDQAVVKNSENVTYYGGKSRQVEKSTRVKARVKAQALKEIIGSRDTVFIMGHRLGDPDSFGAALGIYRIARTLNRKAYIVINERTISLRQVLSLFEKNENYEKDMIIDSIHAMEYVTDNSALVVVDVNKPSITECPELLKKCKSIVVLDHHRQGKEVIENATLSYVEPYASSACEMVSEILQYTGENIKIRPEEADAIYGGIVVDTNNFTNRTGVRTFEAAAFLRRCGADVTRVRKLLRDDVVSYRAKADAVSHAQIYLDAYAISVCSAEDAQSPTVVGAQAANDLLNIKGVKASFVLTRYQNEIFISARSIDEVNVQLIMEKMGGGGHLNVAGCQLENTSIEEAIEKLKSTISKMTEAGDI
ncbi:MAG: DHH family phosphoesterase [Lachnospiraceae bacterium]|nr:DHH family phosphoesterase [Lachnospiraceae bacterium]